MYSSSTLTVAGGSSIDNNTATVSSPVSLSLLGSRDLAMIELEGDDALVRSSARRLEQGHLLVILLR